VLRSSWRSVVVLGGLFIGMAVWGFLNHEGVCVSERRRLTEKELMAAVFNRLNRPETTRDASAVPPVEFIKIPYRNFETYLAEHPNCCSSDLRPIDYHHASFWGRLTGFEYATVGILYHARWRGPDGAVRIDRQQEVRRIFGVSSCGVVTDRYT
jgi:hypothetical protein